MIAGLVPGLLLAAPLAAAPVSPPPAPLGPPDIHLRRPAGEPPLDMRMRAAPDFAARHPERACATTRDLATVARHQAEVQAAALAGLRAGCPAELGRIQVRDGIVVMENDGRMMVDDRWPDLAGRSVTLVPAGGGFSATSGAASYVAPSAAPLFQDRTSGFESFPVTLPFAFPFDGRSYTDVWMTNTGALFFSAPAPPSSPQLSEAQVLYDRTPRIAALQGGTSYYGSTGYFETGSSPGPFALFTWQTGDIEVQARLDDRGEIVLTWNKLNALHGTVAVISGNDAFWSSEVERASWTDPAGDVSQPAPDGPALDVTAVRVRQVPGTGVTRIVLDLAGPLPASGGNDIYYELMFYSDPGSNAQTGYEYAQFRDGAQVAGSCWARLAGQTLELGIPTWRFGVPGPGFDLRISTWWYSGGWQYGDWIPGPGVTLPAFGPRLMTDWSHDLPLASSRPLYESFTLPSLNPYAVLDAFNQAFGSPFIDGLAIYQNVYTDIIFYAGAYSTVGNAQVNGIGVGSKSDPFAPALLHMNTIGYGWNSWEGNRTCVLNQEFGHHWAFFARFDDGGVTSTDLNPDGAHPAGWVHTPAQADVHISPDFSSFGGSYWTDNIMGTFTSATNSWNGTGFWPVELYTMGLLDASEVPDFWYIKNPNPPVASAYWPGQGVTTSGFKTWVTIRQIIANEGPRDPDYASSPKDFRVPFVLVVRPGTLDPAHSQAVGTYCSEWERNFRTATFDRGTVSCLSASTCTAPTNAVGNQLRLVRGAAPGTIRFHWSDLNPPSDDYVILEDPAKNGAFTHILGSGAGGLAGVELAPYAPSDPLFYRVAGRNRLDCIGPM